MPDDRRPPDAPQDRPPREEPERPDRQPEAPEPAGDDPNRPRDHPEAPKQPPDGGEAGPPEEGGGGPEAFFGTPLDEVLDRISPRLRAIFDAHRLNEDEIDRVLDDGYREVLLRHQVTPDPAGRLVRAVERAAGRLRPGECPGEADAALPQPVKPVEPAEPVPGDEEEP